MAVVNLNSQTTIKVNNFPDSVRENPDVYISGAYPQLACFSEILANSVDEAKAGFCDTINVAYDMRNNVIRVQDNGRGIPVAPCDDPSHEGYSQMEVALTVLSAGGKFGGDNGYKEDTGGKNGMGSSVVNALSDLFVSEVHAMGKVYRVSFEKGLYKERQNVVGTCGENEHGTTITYKLDATMFDDIVVNPVSLMEMCQQMAFLNNGLKVNVAIISPEGKMAKKSFCYTDGLKAYLEQLLKGKELAVETKIHLNKTVPAKDLPRDLSFDISFGYTTREDQSLKSFVNSIDTEDGGTHVQGFTRGICDAIRKYGIEKKKIKENNDFDLNDTNRGIVGIIAVRYKKPTFDRQSKTKLDMPKVRTIIANALQDVFYDYLEQNPKEAEVILEKALLYRKMRIKAKEARERVKNGKGANPKLKTLGKLAICHVKDPSRAELWVVEGDSAAGSAKEGRDPETQAILPLFGKVKNAVKDGMTAKEILDNDKLGVFYTALGCGVDDDFDISGLNYDKIMLFADADADGKHIQLLHIGHIWRHAPELILQGHVYIPQPPLFRATKKGQKDRWYYTNAELDAAREELKGWTIGRFKGLGEMSAEQLWETSMNPETRILYRITAEYAEAVEQMLETCLGSNVAPRKAMIMETTFAA